MDKHDERLRDEFQRLRAATEATAPDFSEMIGRARAGAAELPKLEVVSGGAVAQRKGLGLIRVGGWAAVAIAAAVGAIILMDAVPDDGDAEFERLVMAYAEGFSGAGWASPTAGLLDVPGMELTRSVPALGAPIRGLDSAQPRESPDPQGRDS